MLDSKGVEQLVDRDLEGDAAALLKPNLVPSTPGAVWDDGITTTVTRDDVQIVGFSVALDKSVRLPKRQSCNGYLKDLTQLFSWMWSIPLAMAARSVEVKAASMV